MSPNFGFLRDVLIRTQTAAVASRPAYNLAIQLPDLATHLSHLATHLPNWATYLPNLATHLSNLATHLSNLASQPAISLNT